MFKVDNPINSQDDVWYDSFCIFFLLMSSVNLEPQQRHYWQSY